MPTRIQLVCDFSKASVGVREFLRLCLKRMLRRYGVKVLEVTADRVRDSPHAKEHKAATVGMSRAALKQGDTGPAEENWGKVSPQFRIRKSSALPRPVRREAG